MSATTDNTATLARWARTGAHAIDEAGTVLMLVKIRESAIGAIRDAARNKAERAALELFAPHGRGSTGALLDPTQIVAVRDVVERAGKPAGSGDYTASRMVAMLDTQLAHHEALTNERAG